MSGEESITAEEWIARFAREAGAQPPDEAEFEALLRLASVAAHSSERKAAPIACWIAGRLGMSAEQAIAIAETVAPPEA